MIVNITPKLFQPAPGWKTLTRRSLARGICLVIWTMILSACAVAGLRAEDQAFGEFQPRPLFDDRSLLATGPASFVLSLASEPSASAAQAPFHLMETFHLSSLFQPVAGEKDLESDSSVTLFRRPMASRFSYHCWAGFRTGYGQCLSTISMDSLARSRTNGAGVQDPDFVYVKWSFRF